EPGAFAYPARLMDPVSVVDLGKREAFSVRTAAVRKEKEPEAEVWPERTADGAENAVRVTTKLAGDGDVLLEIPLGEAVSRERSMLGFEAKGDVGTEILYLAIRDKSGQRWIAFVDLGPEWRSYEIAMADFVRSQKEATGAEMLAPEEARSLEAGLVSRVLWGEKPAGFSIGNVVLGKSSREKAVRTAAIAPWRNQFAARNAFFPEWIWDPFWETEEVGTRSGVRFFGKSGKETRGLGRGKRWEAPRFPHERGRVHAPASTKLEPGEYQRRVLAAVLGEDGEEIPVVEWRRFNDGVFAGGSLTLIGAPGEDFS